MSFISVQMAKQLGAGGRIAEDLDRAVTTRPSSSANFYVNSLDKVPLQSSGDFLINKKQALFNGFFKRIAVTEVVMDWGLPNVAAWWGNNTMSVVNVTTSAVITATIQDGYYTAIQALQEIAAALTAAAVVAGDPLALSVSFNGTSVTMNSTGVGNDPFYINYLPNADPPYALARQLFTTAQLGGIATANTKIELKSPAVLGTRYIDIISPQLTYNQDLKDATTGDLTKDVLYRWYFADDNVPVQREKYPLVYPAVAPAPAVLMLTDTNIPVLQGYTPFIIRRALPVPKQILWNSEQPIGQVQFQVYDDRGRLIDTANFPWSATTGDGGANFQFQLSMLLSEN